MSTPYTLEEMRRIIDLAQITHGGSLSLEMAMNLRPERLLATAKKADLAADAENGLVYVRLIPTPIPMVIYCPSCRRQHIDEPMADGVDWSKKPHKEHLCRYCHELYRPANLPTVGVAALRDEPTQRRLMGERCHAQEDGDCDDVRCPQLRDGEPMKTGRHCPLDKEDEDE